MRTCAVDQQQVTRLWAARNASNRLAKRAFVALVVVMLLVLLLADKDSSHDVSWFVAAAAGVTAELLWAVVVATVAFSFVVANPNAYLRGRDRKLSRVGSVARTANRVLLRVFAVFLVLPLAAFAFESIGEAARLWDELPVRDAADAFSFVAGPALFLAFISVLVWMGSELRAGFREERPTRPDVIRRGSSSDENG